MIKVLQPSDDVYNDFVMTHHFSAIEQTTPWVQVKNLNGWTGTHIAVGYEDDTHTEVITGTAQILFRKAGPFTFAYCPRGYIVDWSDSDSVHMLHKEVLALCRKHRAFALTVDPAVMRSDPEHDNAMRQLRSVGFVHRGFTLGMHATYQPRFTMRTPLQKDFKAVKKTFSASARNHINRSEKFDLTCSIGFDEKLNDFNELMKVTASRDNFGSRDITYFRHLLHSFGPQRSALIMIYVDPQHTIDVLNKHITDARKQIEKFQAKDPSGEKYATNIAEAEKSISKLEQTKEELSAYDRPIALSGALNVMMGDGAYYVYGASHDILRNLYPAFAMQAQAMQLAIEHGCTFYDFGGISGQEGQADDEAPGLYEFKRLWGTEKREYIGEFELVLSPLKNSCFTMLMNVRKALIALRHRLHK